MFTQLNLHPRLQRILQEINFIDATEVQKKAIPLAIAGIDLFVTAQTGTGKTAAFILPILQRLLEEERPGNGLKALIILPTRELATQVQNTFKKLARYTFFESLLITGGETLKEQSAKLRKNPDIVIGTPGRLLEQWKTNHLILDELKILVLDEADRMLDMGFGEDVITLINELPVNRQTLLFSATKGNKALQDIVNTLLTSPQHLHLQSEHETNSNIAQQIIMVDDVSHKEHVLKWLLNNEKYEQIIIFTNTKVQADGLAKILSTQQIKYLVLHSDKTLLERKQITHRILQSHINILIATDIAARGIDLANVDLVINFDLPHTTEEYIHRIGRTGRIGKQGRAISLISSSNMRTLTRIEQDTKQSIEIKTIKGLTKVPQKQSESISSNAKKELLKHKPQQNKVSNSKKIKTSTLVSADGFAPLKKKK